MMDLILINDIYGMQKELLYAKRYEKSYRIME